MKKNTFFKKISQPEPSSRGLSRRDSYLKGALSRGQFLAGGISNNQGEKGKQFLLLRGIWVSRENWKPRTGQSR